jgi:glycosyltransferase involved in cell wall biosynthesis
MHICFISRRFFPAISGMSVYAFNLLKQMVARGYAVTMVSQFRADLQGIGIYGGGPPPAVPGVRVIGLESSGEQEVNQDRPANFEADIHTMVDTVVEAHQRTPFDIIHAQYAYPTGLAALEASRRLNIPNMVSIQGGDGHWVGLCCATHRHAMQAVLQHAGALLIGSHSFAREVHENHAVPLDRFTIVPGATDMERFRPRPDRELGDLSNPPRFLYHGRVDIRKGLLELIDAMGTVHKTRPDAKLVISGIGPDLEQVKHYATAAGLAAQIDFLGHTDYTAAPGVYQHGDIFVSPTYSEGFSNTILEAMASGLPVISTATIGVVDCIEQGRNGLLVPIKSVAPLAEAMLRMLSNAALRKSMAQQAFNDVQEKYSWPVVAELIASHYKKLAGSKVSKGWTKIYDNEAVTVLNADLRCRFRAAPHLL